MLDYAEAKDMFILNSYCYVKIHNYKNVKSNDCVILWWRKY